MTIFWHLSGIAWSLYKNLFCDATVTLDWTDFGNFCHGPKSTEAPISILTNFSQPQVKKCSQNFMQEPLEASWKERAIQSIKRFIRGGRTNCDKAEAFHLFLRLPGSFLQGFRPSEKAIKRWNDIQIFSHFIELIYFFN